MSWLGILLPLPFPALQLQTHIGFYVSSGDQLWIFDFMTSSLSTEHHPSPQSPLKLVFENFICTWCFLILSILSSSLQLPLPPNVSPFQFHIFLFGNFPLSPISVVHMLMGMGSSTESWSSIPKEKWLYLQTANGSLASSGTFEVLISMLELLTELILLRPYAGNHSSWELTYPKAMSYSEDSISQLSSPTIGSCILSTPSF